MTSMAMRKDGPGPFLKWAGGKGRLAPLLASLAPPRIGVYHEPFLGAGALFFHLTRTDRIERARLSDRNEDLITAYRVVRDDTDALLPRLSRLRAAHDQEAYYQARARYNHDELDDVERAAHLIYLNKTCFNGLYRVNRRGEFNVPVGRYREPRIFDPAHLRSASAALERADLAVADFAAVGEVAVAGDFVYLDPPYDPLTTTASFTGYAPGGFGEQEQARLADLFRALDERGVCVLLSNHDTPLIRKLYGEYERVPVQLTRAINSDASRRHRPVAELIVCGHTAVRARAVSPSQRRLL